MKPRPIPLREADDTPPRGGAVIDAQFTIVRARERRWLRRTLSFLIALAGAAAIGFLVPPLWLVLQEIIAMTRR